MAMPDVAEPITDPAQAVVTAQFLYAEGRRYHRLSRVNRDRARTYMEAYNQLVSRLARIGIRAEHVSTAEPTREEHSRAESGSRPQHRAGQA